jgi:hypothetical protein
MGTTPLEGNSDNYLICLFDFSLKEHWDNIVAMKIRNKHLEPRGCDTIGDTITDDKVCFFFYFIF